MDPQNQDNFDDIDQAVNNRQESIKPDEAAGSVFSNRKVIVKIKNITLPEKSLVEQSTLPPPPPAAAEIFPVEEIKSHQCKECNKSFSSGKALGGHMSSAHVQANKDYSYKKQKPKTYIKKSGYFSGSGPEDHVCVCIECGKCFPSHKSLYGHMRCHPDRDYRGMVEPRPESSQASTEPGFDYSGLNQDEDDGVGSSPNPVGVNLVKSFNNWTVRAKRGRSAMSGPVFDPPVPMSPSSGSSSEEEKDISAGHELLRLLDRTGVKIGGGEADLVGPTSDDMVNSKKQGTMLSGGKANHGPRQEDWDEARDCKRPRPYKKRAPMLRIWNTNGKIEHSNVGKVKEMIVEDGPESEDDILFGAISVLANGKRENHNCSTNIVEKDGSGPSSYQCNTCKKEFSSPQALGGHRSSHKKLLVSIINTEDDINGTNNDMKGKMKNIGGVKIEGGVDNMYVCKVCNKGFATARALGGHKKCHNSNDKSGNAIGDGDIDNGTDKEKSSDDNDKKGGGEEKVIVRGFDLNMMPDDENGAADL